MSADLELARLLEHPAIWRGRSVARTEVLPTGFDALDERLPGKGWPRAGLIEILVSRFGVGELTLLLPALAALTGRPTARWCVWVAPPMEPYGPALAAHGIALERVLVVRDSRLEHDEGQSTSTHGKDHRRLRTTARLWAFEQSLGSGACDVAMAWARRPAMREIRRLQLAAERGRALGVLFRSRHAAQESSHAILRISLEPTATGVRLSLLKSRGGARGSVDLVLQPARS